MASDDPTSFIDEALFYEDGSIESIKISKALPFEIEFETDELEHQHKYGMQRESESVAGAMPEILVTVGLLLFLAALASFGYYYINKRSHYQHGQPLSTPSDSSIDVEKLQNEINEDEKDGKVNLDRRFDDLS